MIIFKFDNLYCFARQATNLYHLALTFFSQLYLLTLFERPGFLSASTKSYSLSMVASNMCIKLYNFLTRECKKIIEALSTMLHGKNG